MQLRCHDFQANDTQHKRRDTQNRDFKHNNTKTWLSMNDIYQDETQHKDTRRENPKLATLFIKTTQRKCHLA